MRTIKAAMMPHIYKKNTQILSHKLNPCGLYFNSPNKKVTIYHLSPGHINPDFGYLVFRLYLYCGLQKATKGK